MPCLQRSEENIRLPGSEGMVVTHHMGLGSNLCPLQVQVLLTTGPSPAPYFHSYTCVLHFFYSLPQPLLFQLLSNMAVGIFYHHLVPPEVSSLWLYSWGKWLNFKECWHLLCCLLHDPMVLSFLFCFVFVTCLRIEPTSRSRKRSESSKPKSRKPALSLTAHADLRRRGSFA